MSNRAKGTDMLPIIFSSLSAYYMKTRTQDGLSKNHLLKSPDWLKMLGQFLCKRGKRKTRLHRLHASPATSWKPSRSFIKISEPLKMDFQHQIFTKKWISSTKKLISSTIFLFPCTDQPMHKKWPGPTSAPGLHQSGKIVHHTPPPPQAHLLSQLRAGQLL